MLPQIRQQLFALQDRKYRDFNRKITPGIAQSIGVRMPAIHRLSRQITQSDFRSYLKEPKTYYEEVLLEGLVIATAPLETPERLTYLQQFIPKIHDWATCDMTAAAFKSLKTPRAPNDLKSTYWDFLLSYKNSRQEFELRFRLVMFLNYFLDLKHLPKIFSLLDQVSSRKILPDPASPYQSQPYYLEMGAAWLVAEAFIKQRDLTLNYLQRDQLSPFTHNKAIQKARESYRVSTADKALLNSLKRHT